MDFRDLRDALQPQDAFAALITLLGLAIAIFLPDPIVKLIGGSIAFLGGVAFYMTLRARINDRVQIRNKRTTLAPPTFKTHVSTDPKTSATRIRFDDFQETFHVEEEKGVESPAVEPTVSPYRNVAMVDDKPWSEVEVDTGGGEGFRIIGAGAAPPQAEPVMSATPPSTRPAATPPVAAATRSEENVRIVYEQVESVEPMKEGVAETAGASAKSESAPSAAAASVPAQRKEDRARPEAAPLSAPIEKNTDPIAAAASAAPEKEVAAPPPTQTTRRQVQLVLEELSNEGEEEVEQQSEPRAEFVRLVNQVLKGIARSIDGRSIIFFWMNLERGHFIPEAFVTRESATVRLGERITLGNDLVSQIARGGVPEIITNISPAAEAELTPYYERPAGTRSFVGVPVFFRNEVVGVLAADSAEESGFDEASVATLAEYTLLISQLIRGYAEKFDLYLIRQGVEAFEKLHAALTGRVLRPPQIAALLVEQVAAMFDVDYTAVILYDKEESRWCVAACEGDEALRDHILSLQPDMQRSAAGDAARRAGEVYLPVRNGEIRIAPEEKLPERGSFLALPLMASAKCYGSLVLGHRSPNAWGPRDITLLRDLCGYVAMAVEVVNANEALEEQLVFDEETGVYNTTFFMGGLDREIDRARDFKTPLSFALIRVETPNGFAVDQRGEIVHASLTEVGSFLARKLRPYDLVGRFDDDTFSVALIGRSDQEAYLWAERLRKEVAGHIIPLGPRTFSVTVSAGVCNATGASDTAQTINGARQALEKAGRDGGNAVVIY